jgi:hypothetical protein
MPLSALTDRDREIVYRCLVVSANESTVFPDSEFHTIFGLWRPDFINLVKQWPNLDESSDDVVCAINNAMNNLLGYPHRCHKDWALYFDFSPGELIEVFAKWRGTPPGDWDYVESLM